MWHIIFFHKKLIFFLIFEPFESGSFLARFSTGAFYFVSVTRLRQFFGIFLLGGPRFGFLPRGKNNLKNIKINNSGRFLRPLFISSIDFLSTYWWFCFVLLHILIVYFNWDSVFRSFMNRSPLNTTGNMNSELNCVS